MSETVMIKLSEKIARAIKEAIESGNYPTPTELKALLRALKAANF